LPFVVEPLSAVALALVMEKAASPLSTWAL
jgi:hypothetical protein